MELTLKSRNRKVKQAVVQDHYWYDHVNKVMLHGRGGRMEFIYVPSEGRLMPRVVAHEEDVWQNDYPLIREWLDKNRSKYGMSIEIDTGRHVSVSIPAFNFDDVIRDLYQNSITFDYDEYQLRKEMREYANGIREQKEKRRQAWPNSVLK